MASTLGKRKERENESIDTKPHGSTLFVSNLPYTATSVDLQTLFSDFAPVRSAFVVLEHGTGVSKGVGYVSFAVKEDAQSAYGTITKDGVSLAGRKLRVEWAENKGKSMGKEAPKEQKPRPPPRPQQPKQVEDPLAIRTIVVSGLPSSVDSKTLWKKLRKYNGAEKIDWPVKSASGDETAHALFKTPAAASEAVSKLHAHVFKGSLLSVTLKKRLDSLSKTPADPPSGSDTKTTATKTAVPSHASRLIVRNLPFNATEQDLRAAFLPYGPIYSIHIPTAEKQHPYEGEGERSNSSKPQRTKGFAFVWMLSKNDAQKAIEGCNGITIRAGSAETLVADKQKRKKQRREEKKMDGRMAQQEKDDSGHEGNAEDATDGKKATERVIAVDWALSKDRWEEEKTKMEAGDGDVETDNDSDVEKMDHTSGDDGSADESDKSDDDVQEGTSIATDDNDGTDSDAGEEGVQHPMKPTLPPPETGTTLFVRNLSFDATEDELRTLFRAFGPLRYARITIDHSTGRSRGTGFACFWNKEDADKVVAQSDILRAETTGVSAPVKKNPFTLPSILTPDPSSLSAQSLVLHGRTLDVVRAVTRDEAEQLREAGEKAREKADKRNMYLLREGVILPNSPAAATLSTADIERRTNSFNARRALLKSNPSLYISKTRLSIRQIPTFVTERMMKRLAMHAVHEFEAEVKNGARPALTTEELSDTTLPPEIDSTHEIEKDRRKKGKGHPRRGVKQAKIVRQSERVDPITGKARSKGYGFVEMNTHADALRVLRWTSNNWNVGPLFEEWWRDELEFLLKQESSKKPQDDTKLSRLKEELEKVSSKKSKGTLIVEFSIENVQVVQRRNAAQANVQEPSKDVQTTNNKQERPTKKRRTEEDKNEAAPRVEKPKNNVGSIIGRKRRERKAGKR